MADATHQPHVGSFRSEASSEDDFPGESANAQGLAFLTAETPLESSQSPRVYIAPRAAVSRQDSFSDYSGTYSYDHYLTDGSESEESDEVTLPRVRVPESPSPRAFVYSRAVGSSSSPQAFVSTRAVGSSSGAESPKGFAGLIDTAAPFESVKDAVSKFGGITDWKAHKTQTLERRNIVEQDLDKLGDDIAEYRKRADAAEEAKQQALDEFERTTKLLEELKLDLEKSHTDEQRARQDLDLAMLRVEETEQGIEEDASFAAKAQLEVAKSRLSDSISELNSVTEEIESVRGRCQELTTGNDLTVKEFQEGFLESKESERKTEELKVDLVATKELLELSHTDYLESQERRFNTAMARDQDVYDWDKELKMVEDEIERLSGEILAEDDVKNRLDSASAVLLDLTSELADYTESKSDGGITAIDFNKGKKDIQAAVASAMEELQEVRLNVEKAKAEVESLKAVAGSLQSEIEDERRVLTEIKSREGNSIVGDEDRMREITLKLQEAAKEASEAKMQAEMAREELKKAEEEAEIAKARLTMIESKVVAAKRELDASRASKKLAMAAANLLKESQTDVQRAEDVNSSSPRSKIITFEEYQELNKRAVEAEAEAEARVEEAVLEIAGAKENETESLGRLAQVNKEVSQRKEELKMAMKKAERAKEGKLSMEQELRKVKLGKEQSTKIVLKMEDFEFFRDANPGIYTPSADIFGRGESNAYGRMDSNTGTFTPDSNVYGRMDSNAGTFMPDSEVYGRMDRYAGTSTPAPEGKPGKKKKKKKLASIAKAFMFLSKKK